MDHNQLYLSKQSSNERTSSMGACSLQGGDSMVNIVEFEETVSPRRRSKRMNHDASIILSTPFKQDEPSDSKIMNLQFKTKGALSQSLINPMMSQVKVDHYQEDHQTPLPAAKHIEDSSSPQFQAATPIIHKDGSAEKSEVDESAVHFKTTQGKKVRQIQTAEEEEFMQMLSGCDTSNDSCDNVKNKNILRSLEKNPGTQMARKTNFIAGKQSKQDPKAKESKEIKLMKAASTSLTAKAPPMTRGKAQTSSSFIASSPQALKELTTLNAKASPNKRPQTNAPGSFTE